MASKETLKQVGETVLPGITELKQSLQLPQSLTSATLKLGNEIVSDLSLQMTLFFNVCYFPAWLIISIAMTGLKYDSLNYLYKFILVTILVAVTIIEIVRLYLGYLGNLTERVSFALTSTIHPSLFFDPQVPELAGFWLLTILLQLPLQGFLLFNEDLIILPIERAANIIMVFMIISELITGFYALRKITRHQARKFHLHQFHIHKD